MNKKENFEVTMFHINAPIPFEDNPRQITPDAIAKVAKSIKQYGFRQPIVVDDNNYILAGHTRLLASKSLGLEHVPVHKAYGLTEAQKRAYRLADNRSAEESQWDFPKLTEEFKFLEAENFDLGLTTFDPSEIDDFLKYGEEPEEGFTDDDEVPEVNEEPITKEGDIWLMNNHRLICGDSTSIDCIDKLMGTTKADMVFTDPPYGIDYSGGRRELTKPHHNKIKNDNLSDNETGNLISLCFVAKKTDADVYVCTSPLKQEPFFKVFKQNNCNIDAIIVWDKKNAGLGYMAYRRQCEFILFHKGTAFHKGDKSDFDLWSCSKDSTNEYVHPTQKPVEIPQRAITNSSKKGDVILDLFGGSGSTLIACQKLGRKGRLMELDPKYCDVIVKRWENYTGKKAVLETKE